MDMTTTTAPKKGILASSEEFDWGSAAGPMQGATGWSPSENAQASSQLAKILQSGSPLMTVARSGAERAAARRGLLASSISAGAGEEAMINTATPIATQDANTWAQSQRDSAQAANDFARDANNFGRQKAMTQYQGILAREAQSADQSFRSSESALERQLQADLQSGRITADAAQNQLNRDQQARLQELQDQGLDRRQAESIAAQERQQREAQLFQRQESADSRVHQETMTRLTAQLNQDAAKANIPQTMVADMSARMSSAVQQILADPNMDGAAKDVAISNYYKYANTQMQWVASFYNTTTPNFMGGESFKPAQSAAPAPNVSLPEQPATTKAADAAQSHPSEEAMRDYYKRQYGYGVR